MTYLMVVASIILGSILHSLFYKGEETKLKVFKKTLLTNVKLGLKIVCSSVLFGTILILTIDFSKSTISKFEVFEVSLFITIISMMSYAIVQFIANGITLIKKDGK